MQNKEAMFVASLFHSIEQILFSAHCHMNIQNLQVHLLNVRDKVYYFNCVW